MVDSVPFEQLCKVLEDLFSNKKNKPQQEKILINFFQELKSQAKQEGKTNCNLYPIIRLLLPELDRERSAYNLKEVKLGQLLVKVLSLARSSNDAGKLLNFRAVRNSEEGSDFPSVAYFVINSRLGRNTGSLTVAEINDSLDKIAAAQVGNKGPILDDLFTRVIKKTSPKQAKWFLRMVLRDLKLGVGRRVLAALHPDAPDLYDQCTSLAKVCEELDEGNTRPAELGVELFSSVSPMLSERLDATRVSHLRDTEFQLEIKFDGERFQLHMKDNIFEYFSRRGFAYSEKYGKTFSEGLLTPLLKNCFRPDVTSVILDGEMMGWDKRGECFGSKGMSYDIKKITESSRYQPCFVVFDILFINGRSLAGAADRGGVPLKERMKILDTVFVDVPGVIIHSQRKVLGDLSDLMNQLNEANEKGEEGLVVKEVDSYYLAKKRNEGWYKIKIEYTEGTMTDLDLLVIGADYAENKTQGLAKSFIVACVDDNGDGPRRFLAVGRVSTGLTFEERERICSLLTPHWKRSSAEAPPPNLVLRRARPELWVPPEYSVVFTVRASELIYSRDFATDYTLRFQRVTAVRRDKPYHDVMTLDDFNALSASKQPVIKLSRHQIQGGVGAGAEEVRAVAGVGAVAGAVAGAGARRKRTAKPLEVAEQFRRPVAEVEATSQTLRGRKICVLSDDEDCKKGALETIVLSHGGLVVQNIGVDTWCAIAGRPTLRARTAITSIPCDILTTTWLRHLPPLTTPCPPPHPLQYLAVTGVTKGGMAGDYDMYGDGYMEVTNEEMLRRCFEKMDRDNEPPVYLTNQEIIDLEAELDINEYSILRSCYLHFKDQNSLKALKARFYGAKICGIESKNLTHVVVECIDNVEEFKEKTGVPIVRKEWINVCLERKEVVDVTDILL